jgi:hypothetical protein
MNGPSQLMVYAQVILMICLIVAVIMVGDNIKTALDRLDNDLQLMDRDIAEVENVCSKPTRGASDHPSQALPQR